MKKMPKLKIVEAQAEVGKVRVMINGAAPVFMPRVEPIYQIRNEYDVILGTFDRKEDAEALLKVWQSTEAQAKRAQDKRWEEFHSAIRKLYKMRRKEEAKWKTSDKKRRSRVLKGLPVPNDLKDLGSKFNRTAYIEEEMKQLK